MCTLSTQEAAFGMLVHVSHFLSKPNFPLKRASAVRSERIEEHQRKGRDYRKKKNKWKEEKLKKKKLEKSLS